MSLKPERKTSLKIDSHLGNSIRLNTWRPVFRCYSHGEAAELLRQWTAMSLCSVRFILKCCQRCFKMLSTLVSLLKWWVLQNKYLCVWHLVFCCGSAKFCTAKTWIIVFTNVSYRLSKKNTKIKWTTSQGLTYRWVFIMY